MDEPQPGRRSRRRAPADAARPRSRDEAGPADHTTELAEAGQDHATELAEARQQHATELADAPDHRADEPTEAQRARDAALAEAERDRAALAEAKVYADRQARAHDERLFAETRLAVPRKAVRWLHDERHPYLRDFIVRLARAGVTDERRLLAHKTRQRNHNPGLCP